MAFGKEKGKIKKCHSVQSKAFTLSCLPEVIFVDNWRVMHGRESFTGLRQICGCYLTRDDVLSSARSFGLLAWSQPKDPFTSVPYTFTYGAFWQYWESFTSFNMLLYCNNMFLKKITSWFPYHLLNSLQRWSKNRIKEFFLQIFKMKNLQYQIDISI